jgi:hypothetical protein
MKLQPRASQLFEDQELVVRMIGGTGAAAAALWLV